MQQFIGGNRKAFINRVGKFIKTIIMKDFKNELEIVELEERLEMAAASSADVKCIVIIPV